MRKDKLFAYVIERQSKGKLKGGDTVIGRKISERVQQKRINNLNERQTGGKNHLIYCSSNKMVMQIWSKNANM